jgi:hypothetical protein
MARLNNPEHRFQTGCRGLDQKLHFIVMLNPSFLTVGRLNGLKAHASCKLTDDQLLCECRGSLLISLGG